MQIKMLGIIGAMEMETKGLKAAMTHKQEVTVTEKRPEDMTRGELEEFLKKSTVEEK